MTSAPNDIRPITSPIPLSEALEVQDVDWLLCPDTEPPASGVSVSSIDIEDHWVFIAIPGLVQHGIRFSPSKLVNGSCHRSRRTPNVHEMNPDIPIIVADPRRAATIAANIYRHPAGTQNGGRNRTNGKHHNNLPSATPPLA